MVTLPSDLDHESLIAENPYDSFYMSEWHRKIRAPTPYRVGGTSIQLNPKVMSYIGIGSLIFIAAIMIMLPDRNKILLHDSRYQMLSEYNSTYPLSDPFKTDSHIKYRIAVIADLDTDSKSKDKKNIWFSYLKYGYLTISNDLSKVTVRWDAKDIKLESKLSAGDRG